VLLAAAVLLDFAGAAFRFAAVPAGAARFFAGAAFFTGLLLPFLGAGLLLAVFLATGFFAAGFFFALAVGFAAFFLTAMYTISGNGRSGQLFHIKQLIFKPLSGLLGGMSFQGRYLYASFAISQERWRRLQRVRRARRGTAFRALQANRS
jgi:hypothetical protein